MTPEILVVVEIPKGSRNKYEYDPATNRFYLDRMLFSAVYYPTDYGFIPETLSEDGDPLDALVLVAEPTFPGCVIRARPLRPREDHGFHEGRLRLRQSVSRDQDGERAMPLQRSTL